MRGYIHDNTGTIYDTNARGPRQPVASDTSDESDDWSAADDDDDDDDDDDAGYDDDAASLVSGENSDVNATLLTNIYFTKPVERDRRWAPKHFSGIAKIDDIQERNAWYRAHYEEIDGLLAIPDVLRVILLPPGVDMKTLKRLRTLYNVKPDLRKKARCVFNTPKAALTEDFGRCYSPTVRPTTFRLLMSLAPMLKLVVQGGDVSQAYTQARWPSTLKKSLAQMPEGYETHLNGKPLCTEVGNLYGAPPSGRHWWKEYETDARQELDQSEWDPCLFYKIRGDEILLVMIYVDDIITLCTKGSTLRDEWAERFTAKFKWKDFGTNLSEFLSINITQDTESVKLDMQRYIEEATKELFPGGVHHNYSTPAEECLGRDVYKASLAKDTSHANTEVGERFRKITMKMLYVTSQVRPDIALAVGLLTRVQAWPSPTLLKHAERAWIYMHGTASLGLKYTVGDTTSLWWAPRVNIEGMSDANFELAHSTSGYIFTSGGAAVAWGVKKQESIALYTQHAEIMAGSLAACESVFLTGTATEIGFPPKEPITLYMDNTSAIDLSYDPVAHAKTKHIDRRDLYIRELVERKQLVTKYVKTANNTADALTKPLARVPFETHRRSMLGM